MHNNDFLNGASHSQATITADYPDWHRGRSRYAVWLCLLEIPELADYAAKLRAGLVNYLWPAESRQLHITLQAVGFPASQCVYDDDVSVERLHAQAQALAAIKPFQVQVAGINSFASALYLPVIDHEGGLARARQVLQPIAPEIGANGYCPHITIGLYRDRFTREALWQAIQAAPKLPSLTITVNELVLAEYQASEMQGPLFPTIRVPLNP